MVASAPSPPPTARRLDGVAALHALTDDPYVRAECDGPRVSSTWAGQGDALGWVIPSRRVRGRAHVVALGTDADAAALAIAVAREADIDVGSVTLPRDADVHLQPSYVLDPRNDWEWFVTWDAPPVQPHEDRVRWLDEQVDGDDIRAALAEWSPRHDAMPGDQGVRRWCGLRGSDGALLAVAAHTEHRPGVPHLASIATDGAVRRQGLGAAVTAWLTRQLLAEGTGWVTLGMYSDNDVARRVYQRLGYRCDHRFTSGRLLEL